MVRRVALLVYVLLIPVVVLCAQSNDVSGPPSDLLNRFSVSGFVRLAPTLTPAARALVSIRTTSGTVISEVVSDDNGMFIFHQLPRGEYTLVAYLSGYEEGRASAVLRIGSAAGINIILKPESSETPPPAGTVSAQTLALSGPARQEYEEGMKELADRHFEESHRHFTEVIKLQPEFSGAYYGVAVGYYFDGQRSEAEKALRKTLELDETNAGAYHLLGRLLNDEKKPAEARPLLEKAVRLEPGRWDMLYELGRSCWAEGDLRMAEDSLRRAHLQAGAGTRVHLLLANVLIAEREYEDALAEMEHYLAADPDGPFAGQVREKARLLRAQVQDGMQR